MLKSSVKYQRGSELYIHITLPQPQTIRNMILHFSQSYSRDFQAHHIFFFHNFLQKLDPRLVMTPNYSSSLYSLHSAHSTLLCNLPSNWDWKYASSIPAASHQPSNNNSCPHRTTHTSSGQNKHLISHQILCPTQWRTITQLVSKSLFSQQIGLWSWLDFFPVIVTAWVESLLFMVPDTLALVLNTGPGPGAWQSETTRLLDIISRPIGWGW